MAQLSAAQQQQLVGDSQIKSLYEQIQLGLQKMRDLQQSKTKAIETLNKLNGQKNENEVVNQELSHLEPEAAVYKLIGPTLVSQDIDDAKQVVGRRLEHIAAEIKRTEQQIQEAEKLEDAQREAIIGYQKQMQVRQAQLLQQNQQKE